MSRKFAYTLGFINGEHAMEMVMYFIVCKENIFIHKCRNYNNNNNNNSIIIVMIIIIITIGAAAH